MKVIFSLSILFLLGLVTVTLGVSLFYPDSNWQTDVTLSMQAPSLQHVFGTDGLGRDLFLRTMHGAKVTLLLGCFCSLLSLLIGLTYGGISAWFGRTTDLIMMRLMEVFLALPQLVTIGLLVLFIIQHGGGVSGLGGALKLAVAISLGSWLTFARLTRNLVSREKNLLYVEAAIATGAPPWRIFWREIGPNLAPSLMIMFGLEIPNFLLFESLLSFMGLGIQPPMSSWGLLVQEGWKSMSTYPHLLFFPALILFLTVFSLNVVFEHWRRLLLRSFAPIDTHT